MKTKDHKPAEKKSPQQTRAEKKATNKFCADLQKAVDAAEWEKVKMPWGKG